MHNIFFKGFIFIFFCLIFLYRDVFLQNKIIFPSNFLAQFYSPWSTEKFDGWEVGIPHKPIGTDPIRFFYPGRTFTNEMVRNGELPLWNPYNFSGSPFLGNFQSAFFYPFNVFYLFFAPIVAWSILIFIQPLLAMLFTYLYLQYLQIRKIAAFFGAFAFGFSGFITIWSQEAPVVSQTALWLPLVLFGIEGFLKTNKKLYLFCVIFALTCTIFAGFFQMAFYIFAFSFLYALFRIKTEKKKDWILHIFVIFIAFGVSILLSSIQLIPSIEAFIESPRHSSGANYLFDTYLLPITHIVQVVIPDIFGSPGSYNFFGRGAYHETVLSIGVIPFIFALFALFFRKENKMIYFFGVALVVTFFLTIDSPLTRIFYQLPIPLIPTFLPTRIFFLTTFSLSILSAFGLSYFIKKKDAYSKRILTAISLVLFLFLILVMLYGIMLLIFGPNVLRPLHEYIIRPGIQFKGTEVTTILRNVIFSMSFVFLILLFLKFKKRFNLHILFIVFLALVGQFYYLQKHLVVGEKQFLYPDHPILSFLKEQEDPSFRFIVFGKPVLGNISLHERLYSPEGMDAIFPRRYGQLIFAAKNDGKLTVHDLPRIEVTLSELQNNEHLLDNARRFRLLSLLGIKYIVYHEEGTSIFSLEKRFPKDVFLPVWQNKNWYIFENKIVLPRATLVDRVTVESDPQKIIDMIFDPQFNLGQNIIIEEQPSFTNQVVEKDPKDNSSVEIVSYQPQKVEIKIKTDRDRMLFLSDNYYPGWRAYLDSNPSKIYRANYTFRAVVVPKGSHTIVFAYEPTSICLGMIISMLSFSLLLFVILKEFIGEIMYSKR